MKNPILAYGIAVGLAFGATAFVIQQGQAAQAGGGLQTLEYKPGLDDLMTMMVQPRHIKLHAAAQAKNWELAAFQLNELRASFRRIGQYLPKYRNYEMDSSVASIIAPSIQKVDAAIKASDSAAFSSAYGDLTAACNTCHVAMEHAFLVIGTPEPSAMQPFIDQIFTPQK
jgi:hypothetical protein